MEHLHVPEAREACQFAVWPDALWLSWQYSLPKSSRKTSQGTPEECSFNYFVAKIHFKRRIYNSTNRRNVHRMKRKSRKVLDRIDKRVVICRLFLCLFHKTLILFLKNRFIETEFTYIQFYDFWYHQSRTTIIIINIFIFSKENLLAVTPLPHRPPHLVTPNLLPVFINFLF